MQLPYSIRFINTIWLLVHGLGATIPRRRMTLCPRSCVFDGSVDEQLPRHIPVPVARIPVMHGYPQQSWRARQTVAVPANLLDCVAETAHTIHTMYTCHLALRRVWAARASCPRPGEFAHRRQQRFVMPTPSQHRPHFQLQPAKMVFVLDSGTRGCGTRCLSGTPRRSPSWTLFAWRARGHRIPQTVI